MPRRKAQLPDGKQVFKLSTGVEFTAKGVGSLLLYDAQNQIKLPKPPKVKITSGGSTWYEENPSDPRYAEAVEEAQRQRNMAALTIMIAEGVELRSPLPDDEAWLGKIRRHIDLSAYEDEHGQLDEAAKKAIYMRYVGISTREDFELIANSVSLTEQGVAEAVDSFE